MISLLALYSFATVGAAPIDRFSPRSPETPRAMIANRLVGSSKVVQDGWISVRLVGSPRDVGFQHGYLLADEITDALEIDDMYNGPKAKSDWNFARLNAHRLAWKHCTEAEKDEIEGIAEGMRARGYHVDADDILTHNADFELGYYFGWLNSVVQKRSTWSAGDHCSAFVSVGAATKDGGVVIGHSNWTNYINGSRSRIMLDIHPATGERILMDGYPGWIHSGDDFGINSAGIAITETTISGFTGFDENGIPEFLRLRRALQFGRSVEDVRKIMVTGNNGAYANMWLIADARRNEIAKLELGLKSNHFEKTTSGSYGSANFPEDPEVAKECPGFNPKVGNPVDRRKRWNVLLPQYQGKIDAELGKKFLSDHHDETTGNDSPTKSSLCGHGETDGRTTHNGAGAFYPGGAVSGKVADSQSIKQMSLWGRMGHPCGTDFLAEPFLKAHPEYNWMKPKLVDMKGQPWSLFKSK